MMDLSLDFESSYCTDKLDTSNKESEEETEKVPTNIKDSDADLHSTQQPYITANKETKEAAVNGDAPEDAATTAETKETDTSNADIGETPPPPPTTQHPTVTEPPNATEAPPITGVPTDIEPGEVAVTKEGTDAKQPPEDTVELTSNDFENDLLGASEPKVAKSKKQEKKVDKVVVIVPKEVPVKKTVPPPKISSREFCMEDEAPCQKKRKWEDVIKKHIINSELLKDLIDVKLKKEEEVATETNLARGRRNRAPRSEPKKKVVKKDEEECLDYEPASDNESESNEERDVTKDPTAFPDPPAEPVHRSRKEENRALLITNLIRPFTVLQLKTMLSHCGKVRSIWINTIKSRCYAVFATINEATQARHSLHGALWPSTSPKYLNVDYAEDERMYSETDGELVGDNINITVIEEQKRKKPKRDKDRKDKPGNVLDELFKKTVAVPSIYWLPLSDSQAKEREEERAKHKPRYFEPEPLEMESEYIKPRAIPRWRTPERSVRRDTDRRRRY